LIRIILFVAFESNKDYKDLRKFKPYLIMGGAWYRLDERYLVPIIVYTYLTKGINGIWYSDGENCKR
jgi:hypothetical protein